MYGVHDDNLTRFQRCQFIIKSVFCVLVDGFLVHLPFFIICHLFQRLEIEEDEDSGCAYDSLSVYDGSNAADGKLLDKMCGTVYPEKITTTTNNMFLQLTTDEAVGGIGFNLTYIITDPPREY